MTLNPNYQQLKNKSKIDKSLSFLLTITKTIYRKNQLLQKQKQYPNLLFHRVRKNKNPLRSKRLNKNISKS